jgi:acetyl esterase/lipase
MAPLADALKADHIATWNIEYRRRPEPGSGWPGTYLDVGSAVDHLRSIASVHRLDLRHVAVLGHSAGGHLAMWVASRARLPQESPLYTPDPLPIGGVVNLAGNSDMEALLQTEMTACRAPVVVDMLGGKPSEVPERYMQTSATRMLPLGVRQILVWGGRDDRAPLWLGNSYAQAAIAAGDPVQLEILPALGHFEIADPKSQAWPVVREAIHSLLGSGE